MELKWLYVAQPIICVSRTCWESISEISQVCQIRFFWGDVRQQVQSVVWSSGISHPNIQVSILLSYSTSLVKISGLGRGEDGIACLFVMSLCHSSLVCGCNILPSSHVFWRFWKCVPKKHSWPTRLYSVMS